MSPVVHRVADHVGRTLLAFRPRLLKWAQFSTIVLGLPLPDAG